MNEHKKLEVGEKYLSIQVLGGKAISCFPNKNKKNPAEPDFRGDGVAVWVNKKKAPQQKDNGDSVQQEDVLS